MKSVLAVLVAATFAVGPSVRPAIARPAEGAVTSLSIVPASGRAEVTIGVAGGVEVRDFTLRSPDRIVLDLTGASLGMSAGAYDRVARGGITDIRYSQYRRNTVRVVLYLDGQRAYQVTRAEGQVHVAVATDPGAQFAAWHLGDAPSATLTQLAAKPTAAPITAPAGEPATSTSEQVRAIDRMLAEGGTPAHADAPANEARPARASQQQAMQQRSQQPRISVTYQGSDIHDVLAAFSAFAGRTIIPSSGVGAIKVDAEIRDQPWDVALAAILASQGLAATEDANGIIIVDTQERIASRAQTEPLVTRIVRLNYQRAGAVGDQIRGRLQSCIPSERGGSTSSSNAAGQPPAVGAPPAQPTTASGTTEGTGSSICRGRGTVSADEVTNSVSITAPASQVEDMIAFAESLDLRQPQVNIKAKIVLVNRTDLDALGIKYDLGTRQQFFNTVIQRTDSAGRTVDPTEPPRVLLGGNTVSAIANASGSIPGAALSLIYSTALGNFDFSTFLDALQQVSLLDIQAEPSVTILNNREAVLISGSQVPFVATQGGGGAVLSGPIAVERVQTGVTLRVTPSVTNNRQINLKVLTINAGATFTPNGVLIDNNSNSTELLVPDGQTVVIGGLTQTTVQLSKSGIPLLVDLPLIGKLFGYSSRTETRRDLLILITPHIIDEGQQPSDMVRR
jgi:type IV pilus assembly protein PilQ